MAYKLIVAMSFNTERGMPSAERALGGVVFFDGTQGIIHQASRDINYASGDFGRDQEAVALDLLPFKPEIARRTLISLAEKQGTTFDAPATYPLTEVAPGRIHHERRSPTEPQYLHSLFANDAEYDEFIRHCKLKSQKLIDQWGEIYYGAVDATPKYLLLAHEYIQTTGDTEILNTRYVGTDGKEHIMQESFFMAAEWIANNANYGPNVDIYDGKPHEKQSHPLIRFKRLNNLGIENQIMMDSAESFIFPDGTRADHGFPIADTGVQGQAYDALLFAADLLRTTNASQEAQAKAREWEATAQEIQRNTLKLWQEDLQYFAMGEDISGAIPTLCANVVELLASTIFDTLSDADKQKYISGIVRMATSPDFLTEVGLRTRALRHIDALIVDVDGQQARFSDYHGVDTIWMEKLRWFIRGLSKQGFHTLADQMRMTLVDAINTEGSHTEFFWVTPDGVPIYKHKEHISSPGTLNVTSLSENEQAWTISATIATKRELGNLHRPMTQPDSWQESLESEILESMKSRGLYRETPMKTRQEVENAREKQNLQPNYTIDTTTGVALQNVLHDRWERRKHPVAA